MSDRLNYELNRASLRFSRAIRDARGDQSRGSYLIPMILDELLTNCCSPEVVRAFIAAVKEIELENGVEL